MSKISVLSGIVMLCLSGYASAGVSFSLHDTATGKTVQSGIQSGKQVVLGDLNTYNFSAQITDLSFNSVRFYVDDQHVRTERFAPFSACGDEGEDSYFNCADNSTYHPEFTLIAQAYSGNQPVGEPGTLRVLKENAETEAFFKVVDADTDSVSGSYSSGAEVDIDTESAFNVAVTFNGLSYDSVLLRTSSGISRRESVEPYALCGDSGGDYFNCGDSSAFSNDFTITAQAYSNQNPVGEPATLKVRRSVVSETTKPVAYFGLIDVNSNAVIGSYANGSEILLEDNSGYNLDVHFENLAYNKVRFSASDGSSRTESFAPYAACGDSDGKYFDCTGSGSLSGQITYTAQAYTDSTPVGEPVSVTVIAGSATPPATDSGSDADTTVAPVITSVSGNQIVSEGGDVTLTVQASGTSPKYQWYFNGSAISGATSSNLVLNDVTPDEQGQYHCVVSNSAGSENSGTVSVSVLAAVTNFDIQVSWNRPSQRADGSPLAASEIDSYRVYYGSTQESGFGSMVEVNGSNNQVVLENLATGEYQFAVSTVDINGLESSMSERHVLAVE